MNRNLRRCRITRVPLACSQCVHVSFVFIIFLLPITAPAQEQQTTNGFVEDILREYGYQSEFDRGDVEYFEPELVRDSADEVFESPEFRTLPRLDLSDGVEARPNEPQVPSPSTTTSRSGGGGQIGGGFADFLRELFGGAATALIALLVLLVAGAILAGIAFLLQSWRRPEADASAPDDATDDEEAPPLVTPGARPPDAWLDAARQAAAAGRFEEAISLLLLGAMAHTERTGLIHPRRGLTYRDYLRVVPRASAWHSALDRLIRAYAPIGFGRRSASRSMFDELVTPYETALATEPAVELGEPRARQTP